MDELATALVMFAQPHKAANGGLVCLHDSGGERQLIIDLADGLNVPLTELQETTITQLKGILDPGLPAVNPLDGWGAGGANAAANMATCFSTLLGDSGAAMGAVVHDRGPNSEVYISYLDYLKKAQMTNIFSALIISDDSTPNLKQRIATKAQDAGLLVAGANGMGFYNVRDRVLAGGFDTRDHPYPGNVTLISQSGAGMSGIVDCEGRIQFNFAVSSGYELTVSMEDYLDYALDLPETRVVGLFLETSRHPEKLIKAFKKANQRGIPIVVLKVGRTDLAAELAISHSGALAGSDRCYQAVFDYYGVQRVSDMDELATALVMFAQPHKAANGGLVCLHDSGGERQLIIDLADGLNVPLTELQETTITQLKGILDPGLPAVNPLDGWGAGGANAAANMATCFSTLLGDSGAAMGAVVHDRGPNSEVYISYLDYLKKAQMTNEKPVFLVANRQGSGSDELAITATHRGFPVIDGVSQFLVGARCLMAYSDFQQRKPLKIDVLAQQKIDYWKRILQSEVTVFETLSSRVVSRFWYSHGARPIGE